MLVHRTHPVALDPVPCEPQECGTCENRDINPICSVDAAREEIQTARSTVEFKAGQTVFYQGNQPLGLYVIQHGIVKLERSTPDGNVSTLRLVGPGQALGYRALFANQAYNASAIAVEATAFCFLPKSTLITVLRHHPEVALNLLQQLSQDLKAAEDKWVTQITKGAEARIAEALIFLDAHFRDQPWTRREIGQWAGTTPETVMRVLGRFQKADVIRTDGRMIEILDSVALQKLFDET